jgi:hypothetical protein
MKIGKYHIEIDIGLSQTIDGFKSPKFFWYRNELKTKGTDPVPWDEVMSAFYWMGVEYRRSVMAGFNRMGIWFWITKHKS